VSRCPQCRHENPVPRQLAHHIGERMIGAMPTPERIMARRPALMLGLGGFYGAIEWFAEVEARHAPVWRSPLEPRVRRGGSGP